MSSPSPTSPNSQKKPIDLRAPLTRKNNDKKGVVSPYDAFFSAILGPAKGLTVTFAIYAIMLGAELHEG